MRRWNGFGVTMALVTVVALLGSGLASADEAVADGDGLTPVSTSALAFGNVCANTTVTKDVLFAITRTSGGGGGNTFKNSSLASVSATVGTGSGSGLSGPAAQNFTVPVNWQSALKDAVSPPITSRMTFAAGAAGTSLNRTITHSISGTAANDNPLTKSMSINASASVVTCDTAAPTLNLPGSQTFEATGPAGRPVTFTATASDANPASPAVTCAPGSGSNFPVGTTIVACSATDAVGNQASGSFSITVQDTTGPVLTAPSDITTEATGPAGAVVSYTSPIATDLVDGGRPVQCTPLSGTTLPLGSNIVTCTSSDSRGNLSTTGFSVTVNDSVDPALTLPVTVTSEATSAAGAVVDFSADVAATDTVDPIVTPVCVPGSGTMFGLGTTAVGCTATDDSGNATSGSFDVVVEDTTAPAITVPASFTEEATSSAGATVVYPASALDLVDGPVVPTCSLASGATFPIGGTTVTCSASDAAGNSVGIQFVVTVVDTTAPALQIPADVIAEADQLGGRVETFASTATDAVDGAVTVSCHPLSGSLFPVGTTTVTCTAVDAHGNEATGDLTVTITDTSAPLVSVPEDMTLEATGPSGATADFDGGVSADDIVDGDVTPSCGPVSGAEFPLGATTVTCSATDVAGNLGTAQFDVTVVDTTGPAIAGTPTDFYVEATGPDGAVVTFTDPTASDLVDGPVGVTCVPGSGGTFLINATTGVTCTAVDDTGNETTSTFSVFVSDRTAPVLAVPGDITEEATGPSGAAVTFIVTASDAVDPDVLIACAPASGSTFGLGTVTVECSGTDDHDNIGFGSFHVSVEDTTPPVLDLPVGITAEATGPDGATVGYAATSLDIVDGEVDVTCSAGPSSTFALGATEVECWAADAAGNVSIGSFSVTVEDTTEPALSLPADITAEATSVLGAGVSFTTAATDLVDGPVLVTCDPAAGAFALGATAVSCSATDQAGNTATGSFTVTVQDTTAPAVTVPAGITAEATSASGASVTYSASSADAVDGPGVPTCTPSSASVFALGTTTVSCTITDAAGNARSATFEVTVEDTTGPAIGDVPSDLTQEATGPAGAVVTYVNPTAVDLVDGPVEVVCTPPSGTTFALEATTAVTCSASDAQNNASASGFDVTVRDTLAPVLTLPSSFRAEATGPSGAPVPFSTAAVDVVDGTVPVSCVPGSGSAFGFGPTEVDCSASDGRENTSTGSFTITVEDTTPPELTMPADITVEATGPAGSTVTYSATALDIVDGAVVPTCSAGSGTTFSLGASTVTCEATDASGNSVGGSFTVTVQDTTAPTLHLPAAITRTATGAAGAAVTYSATASDVVAGSVVVTCAAASGATFAPGQHTVSCAATDGNGNTASGSFTVSVLFDLSGGFLQPVNPAALNTVKGGSTVPLKFQVRTASGGYVNSLEIIDRFVLTQVHCGSLATVIDEVDFTTTGGTSLRFDTGSNQYHQNWQTPKKPGTCYRAEVVFTGGLQRLSANFQLK